MKAPMVANTKSARPVRGMPPREHFGSGANFVQQPQHKIRLDTVE